LLAADLELSQLAVSGLRDYSSLSAPEKARFIATFMAFLSYSQNVFLKWGEGLLEPPLWWLGTLNLVAAPGGREFWKERGYPFGEEFRRHGEDDLMKREPHLHAKPMGAFSISQSATWKRSGV
jgi:hypothetical protein